MTDNIQYSQPTNLIADLMYNIFLQLVINGSLFVAKQFYEAGSGPVDPSDNADFLQQELVRLKQGQWFWDQFRSLAKEKGMDICQGDIS